MDWWQSGEVKPALFCTSGLGSLEEPQLFCWRSLSPFYIPMNYWNY